MIIPSIYPQPMFPTFTPNIPIEYPAYTQEYSEIKKVNGMAGAEAYPMRPNTTVALFDADEDVFYFKVSDISGVSKIRKFRFYEEVDAEILPPESNASVVNLSANNTGYVTVEEFNKLREELDDVKQSVQSKHNKHYNNRSNFNTANKDVKDDVTNDNP